MRTIDVLYCFAEHPGPLTLTEVANLAYIPPSTAHRVLQLLRSRGIVASEGRYRRYSAGSELYRLATLLSAQLPLRDIARPILQRVVNACDETCLLGVLNREPLSVTFVEKVESTKPFRFVPELNRPRSLLWGANGRAILAHLPLADIDTVIASNTEAGADGSLTVERDLLLADLAKIRAAGFAISHGQRTANAVGIAAPFFSPGGVLGDVAITIPHYRFDPAKRAALGAIVRDAAADISAAFGVGKPAAARRNA